MDNRDPNFGSGSSTMTPSEPGRQNTGKWSDAAQDAKQRASDMGRNAMESLDRGRQTAANKLDSAASSLRNVQSSGRVGDMAHRAADKIERTAHYMRDHDVRDMVTDVEGAVRRNPGPSLAIAAAFGFLLGTALFSGSSHRSRSPYR